MISKHSGAAARSSFEIPAFTPGVDNRVFVPLARRPVEDIVVDFGVFGRIDLPGVLGDQKDVIAQYQAAALGDVLRHFEELVVTGGRAAAHIGFVGTDLWFKRDQGVLYLEVVVDICDRLLFAARQPGKRPVDQHVVDQAVVKAVVFNAVVTGVTDIRIAGTPSWGCCL